MTAIIVAFVGASCGALLKFIFDIIKNKIRDRKGYTFKKYPDKKIIHKKMESIIFSKAIKMINTKNESEFTNLYVKKIRIKPKGVHIHGIQFDFSDKIIDVVCNQEMELNHVGDPNGNSYELLCNNVVVTKELVINILSEKKVSVLNSTVYSLNEGIKEGLRRLFALNIQVNMNVLKNVTNGVFILIALGLFILSNGFPVIGQLSVVWGLKIIEILWLLFALVGIPFTVQCTKRITSFLAKNNTFNDTVMTKQITQKNLINEDTNQQLITSFVHLKKENQQEIMKKMITNNLRKGQSIKYGEFERAKLNEQILNFYNLLIEMGIIKRLPKNPRTVVFESELVKEMSEGLKTRLIEITKKGEV